MIIWFLEPVNAALVLQLNHPIHLPPAYTLKTIKNKEI